LAALTPSPPSPQASRRPGRVAAGSGQPGVVLFFSGRDRVWSWWKQHGNRRLIAVGTAAIGGVVLAGTAAQLIGYELFQGRVPALNSASDRGLFGLVGDISIAMATVAAWVVLVRVRPVRAAMVVLPPLLTFLTVDKGGPSP
jgi:hypothetical protein